MYVCMYVYIYIYIYMYIHTHKLRHIRSHFGSSSQSRDLRRGCAAAPRPLPVSQAVSCLKKGPSHMNEY